MPPRFGLDGGSVKTWHGELLVVASVLAGVAIYRGAWVEWLCAAAVLASFGHASVAERLRERDAQRVKPEVECVQWTWRYFTAKEALWASYFIATGAYVALVGVAVFLAFPVWRGWWRKRHPLKVKRSPPIAAISIHHTAARLPSPRPSYLVHAWGWVNNGDIVCRACGAVASPRTPRECPGMHVLPPLPKLSLLAEMNDE